MARVRTFSRQFPAYHPKAGEPTYFVEKFLTSMNIEYDDHRYFMQLLKLNPHISEISISKFFEDLSKDLEPKFHTIRAGDHFDKGDFFSPRVWSGSPYNRKNDGSKLICLVPDVEIKKTWQFKFFTKKREPMFSIENQSWPSDYRKGVHFHYMLGGIAKNDGLEIDDFMAWFNYPKPFEGQIICWNENIGYL